MNIETFIQNIERTIHGKKQMATTLLKDTPFGKIVNVNIQELERILEDAKLVKDSLNKN